MRAQGDNVPTAEQCRVYAADYKLRAADPKNSARRTTVLTNISRSWAALASQLENLTEVEKSERV
jgi:hypothetical protein